MFQVNGNLLANKYAFETDVVMIKGYDTDTTPSINFTMITANPQ